MRALRTLILARPMFAMLLLAMTLCVKAMVPAGYMISPDSKTFTVGICSDAMGSAKTATITIPMTSEKPDGPAHKGSTDATCAFSALALAAMGGVDAPLLTLALLFILSLGFVNLNALPSLVGLRLRPPAQGPPPFA